MAPCALVCERKLERGGTFRYWSIKEEENTNSKCYERQFRNVEGNLSYAIRNKREYNVPDDGHSIDWNCSLFFMRYIGADMIPCFLSSNLWSTKLSKLETILISGFFFSKIRKRNRKTGKFRSYHLYFLVI